MSSQISKAFIGTYAKTILSDWSSLIDIILRHTTPVKETKLDPNTPSLSALSDRQIKDMLEGPLQIFFKQKIAAFALLIRIQMEFNLSKEEAFKEKADLIPQERRIPESRLAKISLTDIEKSRKALDLLLGEHYAQWLGLVQKWDELCLQQMKNIDLSFSELEIKEFLDPEPLSELLDRYVDLNIPLPKLKSELVYFEQYFILKTHLAIHSALSRQHKPHGQNEIKPYAKTFKQIFTTIGQEEQQLNAQQKIETDVCIENIKI